MRSGPERCPATCPDEPAQPAVRPSWPRRAWARLRALHAEQVELSERLLLLNRPWEEELLHWGADGRLHGHLAPPSARRRYSVTSGGWCPGCSAQRATR